MQKQTSNKHYTVEMQRAADELTLCYWAFDELEDAQQYMQSLMIGCTAYPVYVALYDELQQFIEGYKLGDEATPAIKLKNAREIPA